MIRRSYVKELLIEGTENAINFYKSTFDRSRMIRDSEIIKMKEVIRYNGDDMIEFIKRLRQIMITNIEV